VGYTACFTTSKDDGPETTPWDAPPEVSAKGFSSKGRIIDPAEGTPVEVAQSGQSLSAIAAYGVRAIARAMVHFKPMIRRTPLIVILVSKASGVPACKGLIMRDFSLIL
jgi:hypothetical protein